MHGGIARAHLRRLPSWRTPPRPADSSSARTVFHVGEQQDVFSRKVRTSAVAFDLRTDGGGEAEDFIERSLEKVSKEDGKRADPAALLTTQREALSLYRAVWRASFLFVWKNEKGETWKDVIRESARKEFEAARFEKDPEMVARLLVTGRDYLNQAMQKFADKRQSIIDEDSRNANNDGKR